MSGGYRLLGVAVAALCIGSVATAQRPKLKGLYRITVSGASLGARPVVVRGEIPPAVVSFGRQGRVRLGFDAGVLNQTSAAGRLAATARVQAVVTLMDGEPSGLKLRGLEAGAVTMSLIPLVRQLKHHPRAKRVWLVSGSYRGRIRLGGPKGPMGTVAGEYSTYVYAYLSRAMDRGHRVKVAAGAVRSATRGRLLQAPDIVYGGELLVSADTRAGLLEYPSGHRVRLERGGRYLVPRPGTDQAPRWKPGFAVARSAIHVLRGTARILAPTQASTKSFAIYTGAVAGTVQSGKVDVSDDGTRQIVAVLQGSAHVLHRAAPDDEVRLRPADYVVASRRGLARRKLKPEQRSSGLGRFDEDMAQGAFVPVATALKWVRFYNDTRAAIVVHTTWREADRKWHKIRANVKAGGNGYLEVGGKRVRADRVIHWAKSAEGTRTWRGDKKKIELDLRGVKGRVYSYRYR